MLQVLVGMLLIVIIMEITDGFPVFRILSEVLGKTAHGDHHILGVKDQMGFGGGALQ